MHNKTLTKNLNYISGIHLKENIFTNTRQSVKLNISNIVYVF